MVTTKFNLLIGTTNAAKLEYYQELLSDADIIATKLDKDLFSAPEEIGKKIKENAVLKAEYYYSTSGIATLSIDLGLYFEGVTDDEQPGLFVRRVNGRELTDEEMISYYTNLIDTYGGSLIGKWTTGVAIATAKDTYYFEHIGDSYFTSKVCSTIKPGFPLASLQIDEKTKTYRAEIFDKKINYSYDQELKEFILSVIEKQ